MAYSEKVMDHFQHPRNVGEIENASGVGTVGNAKCGDIMRIFLDIDDETHIIKDCKFKTFGCGAAVATSSMATEMVMGKTIEEAMEVTNTKKCGGDIYTIILKNGAEQLGEVDESLVPKKYFEKVPATLKLDRKKLLADAKVKRIKGVGPLRRTSSLLIR